MIKLYADGAAMDGIIAAAKDDTISGFTTNPTLMRQAGVTDYAQFAKDAISYLAKMRPETCLSLEVFADDPSEMIRQARLIDSWGEENNYSVYVKIPVMHIDGTPTTSIINQLSHEGIKLNVTAVFTGEQFVEVLEALSPKTQAIVSIFVGRIHDVAGTMHYITTAMQLAKKNNTHPNIQFLWASSRQAYSYVEADKLGFDIITMTPDLIKKTKSFGKDLWQFSKETCQMFYDDAVKSGFKL